MEEYKNYVQVVDKLKQGVPFGLFEDGKSCYFQDGERVTYTDLWMALRIVHSLPQTGHNKTLLELCPDTFVGTFNYRHSRHSWKKKMTSNKH